MARGAIALSHVADVSAVTLLRLIGGPEREVVAEQLHDECRVFVAGLVQLVELGDGLVERGLGQVARLLFVFEDFVEAHGVVEGEAEADRVSGRELLICDGERLRVHISRLLIVLLVRYEFGEVPVVIAGHLEVEHTAFVFFGCCS